MERSQPLPDNLCPLEYKVKLRPFRVIHHTSIYDAGLWSEGNVTILVKCKATTKTIALHVGRNIVHINSTIRIEKVEKCDNMVLIPIKHFSLDISAENITIETKSPLLKTRIYRIYIEFRSKVQMDQCENGLCGTINYDPAKHQANYLVALNASGLENSQTRSAFPCFDELRFRAKFQLSIGRLEAGLALSNTEIQSTVPNENEDLQREVWDNFAQTAQISPNLVAFYVTTDSTVETVCAIPGGLSKPIDIKLFAPQIRIRSGHGNFVVDLIAKCLNFYEGYFEMEYNLPKFNCVTLPNFINAEAMESFGLTFFTEEQALLNNEDTSQQKLLETALEVSRKVVYQWYGTLVTKDWWTNCWLKRAFATYLSYIACEDFMPQIEPFKYFETEVIQLAMNYEHLNPANPLLLCDLNSILEISSCKTPAVRSRTIIYKKGASIIKMMEGFLTSATLRKSMQNLLKEPKSPEISLSDLFNIFDKQAADDAVFNQNQSFKTIMLPWVTQSGFPLVRVKTLSEVEIEISQEPFVKPETDNYYWEIPVKVSTFENPDFEHTAPDVWLPQDGSCVKYTHNSSKWVILNAGGTGYYRVLYDDSLNEKLLAQLIEDHSVIPAVTRCRIIDDYFSSAFTRFITVDTALEWTKYLSKETEYIVWRTVLRHLKIVWNISNAEESHILKKYWLPKIEDSLNQIGIEQEPDDIGMVILQRAQLISWASKMDCSGFNDYVQKLFSEWKLSPDSNPVPNDFQLEVFTKGVEMSQENADFLLSFYKERATKYQKSAIAKALGSSKNLAHLESLLISTFIKEKRLVDDDDNFTLVKAVAGNPCFLRLVLGFVEVHIKLIMKAYPDGSLIDNIISVLSVHCPAKAEAELVLKFMKENSGYFDDTPLIKNLPLYRSQMCINKFLRCNFLPDTLTWLKRHVE